MFIRFLGRRGGEARNRKELEFSFFCKKTLNLRTLHENMEFHENSWEFGMSIHLRSQQPSKPLKNHCHSKVFRRAGARGGAGAERGGNGGNLMKITKLMRFSRKNHENDEIPRF